MQSSKSAKNSMPRLGSKPSGGLDMQSSSKKNNNPSANKRPSGENGFILSTVEHLDVEQMNNDHMEIVKL